MNSRIFLTALLLGAISGEAHADSKVLILASRVTDNVSYYAPGLYTRTAFTIPSGKSLLGLGAGTTAIHSAGSVTTGNFVTSQSTGSTHISGLRFESPDVLTEDIQGNATEQAAFVAGQFQEIAISLDASEVASLNDCEIEGFRNYGAVMLGTGSHRKLAIDDCKFFGNWHGFRMATDSAAKGNLIAGALQRGIDVNGGAVQLTQNHAYGMTYALHWAPSFEATGLISNNDRFEDSNYGIYVGVTANIASFTNTRLYHNFQWGAKIEGTAVTFVNPQVIVAKTDAVWTDKVGIEFTGQSNRIIGGLFQLDAVPQAGGNDPSTLVRIAGHDCLLDKPTLQDTDGINGSVGLHIPSQIRGGNFEYYIYGFEGATDAALDIDVNTIQGVTVRIIGNSVRSPGFDHTDVDQYIDIPAMWDFSGANANVFYITDEATGQTTTVNDGDAH
jgi:hypothetical protein